MSDTVRQMAGALRRKAWASPDEAMAELARLIEQHVTTITLMDADGNPVTLEVLGRVVSRG